MERAAAFKNQLSDRRMQALLIIDMQVGMLDEESWPHDLNSVVERINQLAALMRSDDGLVVFIQHHGTPEDGFAPTEPGWQLLPAMDIADTDVIVAKTTCDAFYNTELESVLLHAGANELLIAGWATDFCVDTTIRSAASREYDLTVVADAHTAADRSHLAAVQIIRHHNKTWPDLIVPGRRIRVLNAEQIVSELSR